jgi:Lrp/AsnC family transcriptional regulator for asnA, asnC and gidA
MRSPDLHRLVPAKLDEYDRKLVSLMQQDGRLPFTAMAQSVGLSHAAVRQRIQRLLNERVLSIGAVTHPGTHGFTRSAMVCISVDHRVDEVSTALADFDQIYYIVTTNGRYDLLAEVMAEDDRDLQSLVMTIRAIPGVVSTETIPFVDTVKWVFRPGFKEDRQNGDTVAESPLTADQLVGTQTRRSSAGRSAAKPQ